MTNLIKKGGSIWRPVFDTHELGILSGTDFRCPKRGSFLRASLGEICVVFVELSSSLPRGAFILGGPFSRGSGARHFDAPHREQEKAPPKRDPPKRDPPQNLIEKGEVHLETPFWHPWNRNISGDIFLGVQNRCFFWVSGNVLEPRVRVKWASRAKGFIYYILYIIYYILYIICYMLYVIWYVWYMIYDIWYMICDMWYVIYDIWYMIYYIL